MNLETWAGKTWPEEGKGFGGGDQDQRRRMNEESSAREGGFTVRGRKGRKKVCRLWAANCEWEWAREERKAAWQGGRATGRDWPVVRRGQERRKGAPGGEQADRAGERLAWRGLGLVWWWWAMGGCQFVSVLSCGSQWWWVEGVVDAFGADRA
jgi:hypothetical protein